MILKKPRKRVVAAIAAGLLLASGLSVNSSAATVPNRFWCKPAGYGVAGAIRSTSMPQAFASNASGSSLGSTARSARCTTLVAPFPGVPTFHRGRLLR